MPRCASFSRLVPLGRDQLLPTTPVVDDRVLEPIFRQVGVVADDDLEVGRQVGDGIIELDASGAKRWDQDNDGDFSDAGENNWQD